MRRTWLGLVLVGASPLSCAAGDDDVGALGFTAPVTVEADARATIGEIAGPRDGLAQLVREQLARIRFVAAKRDGVAVASQGLIHGTIVLQPAGADEYDVILRDVSMNPHSSKHGPPTIRSIRPGQTVGAGWNCE